MLRSELGVVLLQCVLYIDQILQVPVLAHEPQEVQKANLRGLHPENPATDHLKENPLSVALDIAVDPVLNGSRVPLLAMLVLFGTQDGYFVCEVVYPPN